MFFSRKTRTLRAIRMMRKKRAKNPRRKLGRAARRRASDNT
jgi:hypothetical protein